MEKLNFACDYLEGAHPKLLQRLTSANLEKNPGYSQDKYCAAAKEKIRKVCSCPEAEIHFLSGGTQANAMVIKYLLPAYQGVIAPATGHISLHESGAIEHGGHKVMCVPEYNGKLRAEDVEKMAKAYQNDGNKDMMVMPGMVYISQPTESGTLYSLAEMEEIARVCRENDLYFYVDGARLAYALACKENDVKLSDLGRLCDCFYIGGTKCGMLMGEAVVFPKPGLIPHLYTLTKQHGAMLAKGWLLGLQFDTLFTDNFYETIGKNAIIYADAIRKKVTEKGWKLCFGSPTNQVFVEVTDEIYRKIQEKVTVSFWEKTKDSYTTIRFATSWATTKEDTEKLLEVLDII